jgi:ankyrin repeat protein
MDEVMSSDLEALVGDRRLADVVPFVSQASEGQRAEWLLAVGAFNVPHTTEFARALLDAGTPLDTRGQFGETALHVAAFYRRFDLVLLLLEKGADLDWTTSRSWFVNEVLYPKGMTTRKLLEAQLRDAIEHDGLEELATYRSPYEVAGLHDVARALGTTFEDWVTTLRAAPAPKAKTKKKRVG